MAIEFPNSPFNGQTFTASNNIVYRWDNEKWVTVGSANANTDNNATFVKLSGDHMTGGLTVGGTAAAPNINLDASGAATYAGNVVVGDPAGSRAYVNADGQMATRKLNFLEPGAAFSGSTVDLSHPSGTTYATLTSSLGSGVFCIKSDASSAARCFYKSLGFSDESVQTYRQGNSFFIEARSSTASDILLAPGSAGKVGIGGTLPASPNILLNAGGYATFRIAFDPAANFITFRNKADAQCGRILHDTVSSVKYETTSDYRIKENILPLTESTTRLKALNPVSFNYIGDSTNVEGFIAHEAQAVVPSAVSGKKDEVDENGEMVIQGIDQSRIVPLLTSALQEALTRIEALEAEVTALKGAGN